MTCEEELELLKRTRDFQEAEYLKGHGGSWGICKYQAQVAALREALSEMLGQHPHQHVLLDDHDDAWGMHKAHQALADTAAVAAAHDAKIRDAALEEAARLVERAPNGPHDCMERAAKRIRALRSKP